MIIIGGGTFGMAISMDELTDTLLALPLKDRTDLVLKLLASLDDQEEDLPPGEVDALWKQEIQRRKEEFLAGKVALIPGEQVLREARAQLGC